MGGWGRRGGALGITSADMYRIIQNAHQRRDSSKMGRQFIQIILNYLKKKNNASCWWQITLLSAAAQRDCCPRDCFSLIQTFICSAYNDAWNVKSAELWRRGCVFSIPFLLGGEKKSMHIESRYINSNYMLQNKHFQMTDWPELESSASPSVYSNS